MADQHQAMVAELARVERDMGTVGGLLRSNEHEAGKMRGHLNSFASAAKKGSKKASGKKGSRGGSKEEEQEETVKIDKDAGPKLRKLQEDITRLNFRRAELEEKRVALRKKIRIEREIRMLTTSLAQQKTKGGVKIIQKGR